MPENKIYQFLKENNLTNKDETTFVKDYADPQKSAELHSFFKENNLTTKSADDFYNEYFSSTVKKNETPSTGSYVRAEPPTQTSASVGLPKEIDASQQAYKQFQGLVPPKLKEQGVTPTQQSVAGNVITGLDTKAIQETLAKKEKPFVMPKIPQPKTNIISSDRTSVLQPTKPILKNLSIEERNAELAKKQAEKQEEQNITEIKQEPTALTKGVSLAGSIGMGAAGVVSDFAQVGDMILTKAFESDKKTQAKLDWQQADKGLRNRINEYNRLRGEEALQSDLGEIFYQHPEYKNETVSEVFKGVGQVIPSVAIGLLTGGASTLGQTAIQIGMSAPQIFNSEYKDARKNGANEETAIKSALFSTAGQGALDIVPVMRMLERFNRSTGGGLWNKIKQSAANAGTSYAEGMVSEGGQKMIGNAVASYNYNDNIDLLDGVFDEANIGGWTNSLISFGLSVIKAAKGKAKSPKQIEYLNKKESELNEINKQNPNKEPQLQATQQPQVTEQVTQTQVNEIPQAEEGEKAPSEAVAVEEKVQQLSPNAQSQIDQIKSERANILASLDIDDNGQPIITDEASAKLKDLQNQALNIQQNDSQNITGVSSQVGRGQESVEAKPIEEAGGTPPPSGRMVQEQTEQDIEAKKVEEFETAIKNGDVGALNARIGDADVVGKARVEQNKNIPTTTPTETTQESPIGNTVSFEHAGSTKQGVVTEIDDKGNLIIEGKTGNRTITYTIPAQKTTLITQNEPTATSITEGQNISTGVPPSVGGTQGMGEKPTTQEAGQEVSEEQVEPTPTPTEEVKEEAKEGFTEGKDLNKMFAEVKAKYGAKKGAFIYDAAIRLANPNKNKIIEIRSNGIVVKQGEKYIFRPFGNTDSNPKNWVLYKGMDISEQFEKPKTEKTKPTETNLALRDVESTAKALEGKEPKLTNTPSLKEVSITPIQNANLSATEETKAIKAIVENDNNNSWNKSLRNNVENLGNGWYRVGETMKGESIIHSPSTSKTFVIRGAKVDSIAVIDFVGNNFGNPKEAAEAYHKAKADGSNPELVKAVEDLLGKQPQPTTKPTERVQTTEQKITKEEAGEALRNLLAKAGVIKNIVPNEKSDAFKDIMTIVNYVAQETSAKGKELIDKVKKYLNDNNASQIADQIDNFENDILTSLGEEVKTDAEQISQIAEKTSISPKNLRDLYTINRELFGLNKIKAFASAVAMDRMVGAMAKRAGITKTEMYGRLKFERDIEENVLKADNALFQGTVNGQEVSLKNIDVDVVNGFYSPIEKRLAETKIEKQSANKWLTVIGKGDEAIWTGVKAWLESKNPQEQVSKAEIQQWMKDNRISVVEVVKGGEVVKKDENKLAEIEAQINSMGFTIEQDMGGEGAMLIDGNGEIADYDENEDAYSLLETYNELSDDSFNVYSRIGQPNTKFSQYQLEGEKENYKEILVTLPMQESNEQRQKRIDDIDIKRNDLQSKIDFLYKQRKDETKEYKDLVDENERLLQERNKILYNREDKTFRSSHFDEPNILVHLRMNTRTDADGNKVLFLEEVQSDWGQQGKREGFSSEESSKKIKVINSRLVDIANDISAGRVKKGDVVEEQSDLIKERDRLQKSERSPSAPFVTDTNAWTKLGLKTALKEAVKQGADKIAWTTGEQQNERYDLSKQVQSISYEKKSKEFSSKAQEKGQDLYSLYIETKESGYEQFDDLTINEVENYVGKDIATKIQNNEGSKENLDTSKGGKKVNTLTGVDLKVGGKGMKGFYGSPTEKSLGIVGNVAKSLFKQEPKTVSLTLPPIKGFFEPKEPMIGSTQHSIDITPELKTEVEKGLALFQREQGASAKGAMVAADGSYVIYALTDPNVSTPLHELAHVFEHYLTDAEKQTVIENAGTKEWTTETSEYFARGFEKYLADGSAPTTALQKIYDNFKQWLTEIYNGIKNSSIDIKISPQMKEIYDSMLAIDAEQIAELYNVMANAQDTKTSKDAKKEITNILNKKGNEKLKFVYMNIAEINKQLEDKGLLTKKGDCP